MNFVTINLLMYLKLLSLLIRKFPVILKLIAYFVLFSSDRQASVDTLKHIFPDSVTEIPKNLSGFAPFLLKF